MSGRGLTSKTPADPRVWPLMAPQNATHRKNNLTETGFETMPCLARYHSASYRVKLSYVLSNYIIQLKT